MFQARIEDWNTVRRPAHLCRNMIHKRALACSNVYAMCDANMQGADRSAGSVKRIKPARNHMEIISCYVFPLQTVS